MSEKTAKCIDKKRARLLYGNKEFFKHFITFESVIFIKIQEFVITVKA